MTTLIPVRRPLASAIGRGVRVAAVGTTLALASSVSVAQQGWETTVTATAPPKQAPAALTAAAASPKAKAAPAAEPAAQPDRKTATLPEGKPDTALAKGTGAEEYCANIVNPAADARFAWQKKVLAGMEQEIVQRIALLEEKTAELQKWVARRDEFSKKANETLLRIYSRMRPDAAAVQMAALDEETAASLLVRLEPRTASLILNEMEPGQAVRLSATISGAGKVAPGAPPRNTTEAKSK